MLFPAHQEVSSDDGPPSTQWVLTDVADNKQLGTPERIREKAALAPLLSLAGNHRFRGVVLYGLGWVYNSLLGSIVLSISRHWGHRIYCIILLILSRCILYSTVLKCIVQRHWSSQMGHGSFREVPGIGVWLDDLFHYS